MGLHFLVISKVMESVVGSHHPYVDILAKYKGLNKCEQPKLAMVEFSDTATNPEAVVVELPDAPIADLAMLGSIGDTLDAALLAPSVWWNFQVCHVPK